MAVACRKKIECSGREGEPIEIPLYERKEREKRDEWW
jgi:hypothetical protein